LTTSKKSITPKAIVESSSLCVYVKEEGDINQNLWLNLLWIQRLTSLTCLNFESLTISMYISLMRFYFYSYSNWLNNVQYIESMNVSIKSISRETKFTNDVKHSRDVSYRKTKPIIEHKASVTMSSTGYSAWHYN